jgi:SAM-dependent methyltransferase/chromosome segregation ATPase
MEPNRHEHVVRVLRRLPSYIYLHDVFYDRRVLEIGCGDGSAAAYLARNGAQTVVGVDRDAPLVAEAQRRHRAANLSFRGVADYGLTDLEDRSFDVVCVPPGGAGLAGGSDLSRWVGFLEEVRRVLARGGTLVVAAPSSDRAPSAGVPSGGVSYHELTSRLEPLFGQVRMIGVQPFLGMSLVEFDEDAELDELELDTSLTSLGAGRDGVVEYVAIAGGVEEGEPRGFLLVELPTAEGVAALAEARGSALEEAAMPNARLEERLREAESAHADALLRLKELEGRGGRGDESDLRRRLAKAVEERSGLEAEIEQLSARLGAAEEEVGRVAGQAAIELADARARVQALEAAAAGGPELEAARKVIDELTQAALRHEEELRSVGESLTERDAYVDELRAELDETLRAAREAVAGAREASGRLAEVEDENRGLRRRLAEAEGGLLAAKLNSGDAPAVDPALAEKLSAAEAAAEKATKRWKEAEAKTDELWRKIGDMQREAEQAREQGVENARAQRQAAQIALTRAVDEASKKLVSANDQLSRTERERAEREKEAISLRAEKAELLKLVEATEGRAAQAENAMQSALAEEREGARARESALLETIRVRDRQLAEREPTPPPRQTEPDAGAVLDLASARGELEAVRGELYGALHDLGLTKRELEELRGSLVQAEAALGDERDAREAAQVELEFVRGELTQMRHDLASAMQVGNAVPATATPSWSDPGVVATLDEVTRALHDVEAAVAAEEAHLSEIEGALFAARDEATLGDMGRMRSEPGDLGNDRVRALSEELGLRDAELALMHGQVASGRRRAAELVERIRAMRERAALVSPAEMTSLLDRLADEAMRLNG